MFTERLFEVVDLSGIRIQRTAAYRSFGFVFGQVNTFSNHRKAVFFLCCSQVGIPRFEHVVLIHAVYSETTTQAYGLGIPPPGP